MLDVIDAVRRLGRRMRVAPDEAQLGLDFSVAELPVRAPPAAAAPHAPKPETHSSAQPATPPATQPPPGTRRPARGAAARRAQEAMLLHRLSALGLRSVDTIALMRTRRVMVSLSGRTLRIHEGYLQAPETVLRAVVTFVTARTRAARLAARDVILAHPVERPAALRRPEAVRPADQPLLARLADAHRDLNVRHFGGQLQPIPVRLSGRMKTRLGHYSPAGDDGPTAEIVLGRRHLRRDGWAEGLHTLLHEMVHQWQDETGHPLDHGPAFRAKAREVGVLPRARRAVPTATG